MKVKTGMKEERYPNLADIQTTCPIETDMQC